MRNVSLSSCIYCMYVSCVPPVAFLPMVGVPDRGMCGRHS